MTAGRAGGDIIVVTDSADASTDSALAAGLRLARRTGAHLTVLDAARREAPDALARQLAGLGVRLAGYASLPGGRIDARTLAAHGAHAGLLVLPAAASGDRALVMDLAARIRGTLMLLRGPRSEDAGDDT